MRTQICVAAVLLLLCASGRSEQPAFSDAVGFGIETPAGRGGEILRVTTLAPRGPGSLREALLTSRPRIVVFEVGGIIDLEGEVLVIGEPFLTVAGETAPPPGITIIRGGLSIRTHDVLVRHIRVRPGDAGRPRRSGWEPDAVSTFGGSAYNVVIDHCSLSWAVDENLSASGPRNRGHAGTSRDVTFSNCIIAEGLHDSSHRKGPHSKGSLVSDFCSNVAVIGNLFAHNHARNPYFKAHATGVVVNNLIYDPGVKAISAGYVVAEYDRLPVGPENAKVAVVGNVLLHGPGTVRPVVLVAGRGDIYLDDNIALRRSGDPITIAERSISFVPEAPVWPHGLEPLPARDVTEHVLKHAGARPTDRDAVDERIVESVRNRTGGIIDSQDDVGGYPRSEATWRRLDVPAGGVDEWLARLAAELE